MVTPPPGALKRSQQRFSLTPTSSDLQDGRTHDYQPRSAPTSPRSDVVSPQALDRVLESLGLQGTRPETEDTPSLETKVKVEKRTRFVEPPPPVHSKAQSIRSELGILPSKGKSIAYAKRMELIRSMLQRRKSTLATMRSELAHKESVAQQKQEYVHDSLKTVVEMVMTQKAATDPDELQSLLSTLQTDSDDHKEHLSKLVQYREQVHRLDTTIQHLDTKHDHVLQKFLNNAVDEEDAISAITDDSLNSARVAMAQTTTPQDVDDFLDRFGDRRIIVEQLLELDEEHKEELERREILSEQETPVLDNVARRTDQTYSARREELNDALRQADDRVIEAYEMCLRLGHEPEQYMTDVRLGNPDDMSDGSQDQAGDSSGNVPVSTVPTTLGYGAIPPRKPMVSDELLSSFVMELNGTPNLPSPAPVSVSPGGSEKVQRWLQSQQYVEEALLDDPSLEKIEDTQVHADVEQFDEIDEIDESHKEDVDSWLSQTTELQGDNLASKLQDMERRELARDEAREILNGIPSAES